MKKTLKSIGMFALIILLVALLSACGSGGGGESESSNSSGAGSSNDDASSSNSNGYFFIPQDGDKIKTEYYSITTYTNLPDNELSSVIYSWYSGTQVISGVETLKGYNSSEGFNESSDIITYSTYTNNEMRHYRTDFGVNNSQISGSHIYDPYLPMPLTMEPGKTYSYSYSYTNTYTGEQGNGTVTYSDIQNDSITTHFGTYSDCLKVTRTSSGASEGDSSIIWWYAKNIGPVRYIASGEGWSTTVDYKYTFY